jgi:hypothetical protein
MLTDPPISRFSTHDNYMQPVLSLSTALYTEISEHEYLLENLKFS